MTWLKIDDGFNENPKIEKLHDRPYRVHVSGLVYCSKNLTDGYLSDKALKVLGAIIAFPVKRHVAELVDANLWTPCASGDGYWIKDYLKYNPAAESVRQTRDERSEAGRRGAKARWNGNSYGNGHMADAEHLLDAPVVVPVPARPVNPTAVTAGQEIEHEIDKLLRHINNEDEGTRGVLLSIARKLPLGNVAKVRESCQNRTVGAGYAVNALREELAELEEAIADVEALGPPLMFPGVTEVAS